MAKNVVITGATSGIGEAIARAIQRKVRMLYSQGVEQKGSNLLKTEFAEAFPNQKVWIFSFRCYGYEHG